MNNESDAYQTYLLRLWRTRTRGCWQWRVSIENPHTGERQSFADLEQCFDFLRTQCNVREDMANGDSPGKFTETR